MTNISASRTLERTPSNAVFIQFEKAKEFISHATVIQLTDSIEVRRLFVFMGGADPTNETAKVLRSIQLFERPEIAVDVIIGASTPHHREIETLASQIPHVTCHRHVENMAKLMAAADIGIGAAGTSTWERCCLGLPSLVMILADNQRDIAENLDKNGVVKNLGWYDTVTEADIYQAIYERIQHPDRKENMSTQSQNFVDGKGTVRVAKSMMEGHDEIY